MKRAYCLIRDTPTYRREAFIAGLSTAGFHVVLDHPSEVRAGDALCIWNRYLDRHDLATRFEAAGGHVLVAENGYVLPGGGSPHDAPLRDWFALARSYHNDDTVITGGDSSRWDALDVKLDPWRETGGHVLVCPNRSFGTPGRYMPFNWAEGVAALLKRTTKREIRIRPHPGNSAPARPLCEDLAGAWATVIWSSSAGVHSLIAGVPVICEAPFWIAKEVAGTIDQIESPQTPVRQPALKRIAWAQWSLAEIQSGEAFDHVLLRTRENEVRAAD
jgi:hypothetical protein